MLAFEYQVHISQVSPQFSCSDTCQLWMWFKEFTRNFYKIKNVANGEINEWSFSNPHTWLLASPKHNDHGMALLSRSVFIIRKVELMISVKWWTWTDKLRKCFWKSNIYPVTKQTLFLHILFINPHAKILRCCWLCSIIKPGHLTISGVNTYWKCSRVCTYLEMYNAWHQSDKWKTVKRTLLKDGWTHWGRVTHICVSKLTIIGSDNGLSPDRRQAIIWMNAGILSIGPLGTNFSETLIEICIFSFKKIHLKLSSGSWRPFLLGLNVITKIMTRDSFHKGFTSSWLMM